MRESPLNQPLREPVTGRRRSRMLRTVIVVSAAFAVGVPAAYLAGSASPTMYEAEGALWIDAASTANSSVRAGAAEEASLPGHAWIELLRSYVVLDVVAEKHLNALGYAESDEPTAVRDAARELTHHLMARMDRSGNFLRVAYTDRDPRAAAEILNDVMAHYVEVAADLKQKRLEETTAVQRERLDRVVDELAEAERDLERYRVGTIEPPGDAAEMRLARTVEEVRHQRRVEAVERVYEEVRSQWEAASLAQMSAIPDVRILDAARVPTRGHRPMNLLLALVAFVAIVGAIYAGLGVADRMEVFGVGRTDGI